MRARDHETPRPPGEVVWFHLGHIKDHAAVLDIIDRLVVHRTGVNVLLTTSPGRSHPKTRIDDRPGLITEQVPDEHPHAVDEFLDHWRPDMCLWLWGGLRPNLVHETSRRNIPMHLIAAEPAGFDSRRDRWLPELSRQVLRSFVSATAASSPALERLARLGLPREKMELQPKLRPTGRVLPCQSSDLDEITQYLAGRPVWLAAQTQKQEWSPVLRAHRAALRNAHRLLLVLEPTESTDLEELCALIDRHGLTRGIWGNGEWPDETVQVLIADIPGELGLWYRLATVSFLGSSLGAGQAGIDPFEAAALGTAILYGPNVGSRLNSYTLLANAGAARIVNDADSLATAVHRLVAPDQAAVMAHAGWDVTSQGAEVVDGVVDLIQNGLDDRAATKEHP
ncbi:3-deoxy-D-manno-octulosonic acid transferase [Aliishimia ponticola]|uniref:3-deoxy-D-manno-octulosonic acid transferase n=1 Tax=Aliishimia ponticola TaxID=2499833 RepID=UPI001FE5620B|nr:glycosyltransferase N-terminal domain-containing protein [Aliishimia ponticola]